MADGMLHDYSSFIHLCYSKLLYEKKTVSHDCVQVLHYVRLWILNPQRMSDDSSDDINPKLIQIIKCRANR